MFCSLLLTVSSALICIDFIHIPTLWWKKTPETVQWKLWNCFIKAPIAFRTLFTVIMHSSEQWAVLSCASHHSTTAPIITENNVDSSITTKRYICVGCWEICRGMYKGHYGICRSGCLLKRQEHGYMLFGNTASIRGSRWTWWLGPAAGHYRHTVHSTDGEIRHQRLQSKHWMCHDDICAISYDFLQASFLSLHMRHT